MTVLDRFRLDGRTALVTGASRGLGRAVAQALAEAGADLVIVGRDAERLTAAKRELAQTGRTVHELVGDVGTPAGAVEVCGRALALGVPLSILVNNVGGRRVDVPLESVDLTEWQALVDLNLTGALACCREVGRGMLERRFGAIVNVTSVAAAAVIPGIGGRHYEVAKAALAALTRSLAADWAGRGVRVNAVAPGVFDTAPNRAWFAEKPDYRGRFLAHIPMGRLGEPEELGAAVVFLASDAARYVTGTTLTVDGGYTLW